MNSIRFIKIKLFFKNNKILAFLFLLSFIFTAAGVLSTSYSNELYSVFSIEQTGFVKMWLNIFFIFAAFLLFNLISSFFMFGIVTSIIGVCVTFLGIGASAYATVSMFGYNGLLANFLLILVISVFLALYLIFSAKSMQMTLFMAQKLSDRGGINTYSTEVKRYLALFAVMIGVSLIASALIAGAILLCTEVLNLI